MANQGDFVRELDEVDMRILRVLQSDGDLTVSEVAERVGLSQSPCSRRIALMHEDGVILGKTVVLAPGRLGLHTALVVRIKLKEHDRTTLDAFRKAVRAIPEIQSALLTLGDFDFHLQIVVRDIEHYHTLLQDRLVSLPGVRELHSSVVVDVVKTTAALPI